MSKRRGVTLVEALLATSLAAIVIGSLVAVYGFCAVRFAHAYARGNAVSQADRLVQEIATYVASAKSCSLVTSGTTKGLKIVMPQNGIDRNRDSENDDVYPNRIRALSYEQFDDGVRVWFYLGDAKAGFASSGTTVCKAVRYDDSLPSAPDVQQSWVYYYDRSVARYNLVTQLDFVVSAGSKSTKITVKASSLIRGERPAPDGTPTGNMYEHSVSRTVIWRNWRP